jgi:hypothetical protein
VTVFNLKVVELEKIIIYEEQQARPKNTSIIRPNMCPKHPFSNIFFLYKLITKCCNIKTFTVKQNVLK